MGYTADQFKDKIIFAAEKVNIYAYPEDGAQPIGTIAKGQAIGRVYSWLNIKPGRKEHWWQFYANTAINGGKMYYAPIESTPLDKEASLQSAGIEENKGGLLLPIALTLFSGVMAANAENRAARYGFGAGAALSGAWLAAKAFEKIDLNPFGSIGSGMTLSPIDDKHSTHLERTAIKQMIERGMMEGQTSPKKQFKIIELSDDFVKVEIYDKYKSESRGTMEWLKHTHQFKIK